MKKTLIATMLAFSFPLIVLATAISPRAKVVVRNPATSNGTITFSFQPRGGVAKTIVVDVKKGWTALRISREIASKLTNAMPRNYRATSRRHGTVDYVAVEKDVSSAANFSLQNTDMTVEGVSVEVVDAY